MSAPLSEELCVSALCVSLRNIRIVAVLQGACSIQGKTTNVVVVYRLEI